MDGMDLKKQCLRSTGIQILKSSNTWGHKKKSGTPPTVDLDFTWFSLQKSRFFGDGHPNFNDGILIMGI